MGVGYFTQVKLTDPPSVASHATTKTYVDVLVTTSIAAAAGAFNLRGLRADQPLATAVDEGTTYYVTDEFKTERSDGAAWEDISDHYAGAGSGDVLGPVSSVDENLPMFTDTSGKILGDSGIASADLIAALATTLTPREVLSFVTGSLAFEAEEAGVFDFTPYKAAHLISISTTRGGYLVLYATEDARDDDVRPLPTITDPDAGIGVLAEISFPVLGATYLMSPSVVLFNGDAPTPGTEIYYRFYSSELITGTTTIDFTVKGIE